MGHGRIVFEGTPARSRAADATFARNGWRCDGGIRPLAAPLRRFKSREADRSWQARPTAATISLDKTLRKIGNLLGLPHEPVWLATENFAAFRFPLRPRSGQKKLIGNCQAGVSRKCHMGWGIDVGADIFRDKSADF